MSTRSITCRAASFLPIMDTRDCSSPVLLILGSAPGVVSLQKQEYYGHPSNHFWRILENLFDIPAELPYRERCRRVIQRRIVLWDVCHEFNRTGSSDSSIHGITVNAIEQLIARLPSIQTIACNGQQAARLLNRHTRLPADIRVVTLPSSSPAHAIKNAVLAKTELWRNILGCELLDQIV
uniref:Uracil-DNA glycosylase-like domain-containing protein n=1 Tax=Spongospora subterranea TaxID=70186 RepID=A0A0H5RH03_9EUKA|eukprot:CRZ12817.1 hypothetical protein [Spongospora subterranea]